MPELNIKRVSTGFLQIAVVLLGIGALALLLIEPSFEGRNVGATVFQVYFQDPFLAYVYLASIAFFIALFQAFRLLGYIAQNNVFSKQSMKALRIIKYCALSLIVFIAGAEAYFFLIQRGKEDDIAGGVAMGLFLLFASIIVATATAVFERLLQNVVDLKSENELTV